MITISQLVETLATALLLYFILKKLFTIADGLWQKKRGKELLTKEQREQLSKEPLAASLTNEPAAIAKAGSLSGRPCSYDKAYNSFIDLQIQVRIWNKNCLQLRIIGNVAAHCAMVRGHAIVYLREAQETKNKLQEKIGGQLQTLEPYQGQHSEIDELIGQISLLSAELEQGSEENILFFREAHHETDGRWMNN